MAPVDLDQAGPHPSAMEVAQPFIFEQKIQESLAAIAVSEAKEDQIRLHGVAWIESVRKALSLPVRTFNTACVRFHKFRLSYADTEYNLIDAAAAALFVACKIEDTLKKSRDILCAAANLRLSPADFLSPDDPIFEASSRTVNGLERLMLESSGFDFRNRHPQELIVKFSKACPIPQADAMLALDISVDLHRTLAPLKQTTTTMAAACVELCVRLRDADLATISYIDYEKWAITRAEVMETLLDLLDLYTHHRGQTTIGPRYPLDTFIAIRIALNQEASAENLPRFTESSEEAIQALKAANATDANGKNGATGGGSSGKPSPQSPLDAPGSATSNRSAGTNRGMGERGRDGTLRFLFDMSRSQIEKEKVDAFFKDEYVDTEVEFEVKEDGSERELEPRNN